MIEMALKRNSAGYERRNEVRISTVVLVKKNDKLCYAAFDWLISHRIASSRIVASI